MTGTQLKKTILQEAIEGRLVPQDPNDEPASLLLQRIHEEKERLIKEGKIKRSKTTATATIQKAPSGWICCRFDEICSKFSTGPFGSMVHKSDYVSQNGTPIVNPMNIVDGAIVANSLMMVSNEKAQELERYRLSKDDILIARRGDLSKCAIVTDQAVGWLCGTGSFFLHAPFVEPRYIELFYLSEYVQTILKRECVGATMDNLNQSVLGSIPFLLPPLAEQQRIVNEVERWFAVIDALESNEGDLLKAIDQAKSKILDLAIHGKLVPQDPNDEPAIELLKRINPKFEACDNEDCPFEIPTSWEWTTLGVISNYGNTTNIEINNIPQDAWVLELEDLEKDSAIVLKRVTKRDREIKGVRHSFKNGDVLYSKLRTYLNKVLVAPEDGYCTTEIIPISFQPSIHSAYINHVLRSRYFLDYTIQCGYGVKMPRLSTADARKGLIPIPPYKEQLRIVAKIEELFGILDGIKEALEA